MRRYLIASCLVLAVFTLFSATPAQADTIDNFTYQAEGNTFTWQLPSSPTILASDFLPGLAFGIPDVAYAENDIPQNPASPTFLTGTFCLTDFSSGGADGIPATLTITSVPEPSSLMLLGTGMLALLGFA